MGRQKGVTQTGRVAAKRRERKARREAHKEALVAGTVSSELPAPLVPELFQDIQMTYWPWLKAVPDPRVPATRIDPLYLILHRIITGFVGGGRFIGIVFPKTHHRSQRRPAAASRTLGALPTRPAVYARFRRIDWQAAHAALAPLWERLGSTPQFLIRGPLRDPQEILAAFRQEQVARAAQQAAAAKAAQQAAQKAQGMSAARAKRQGSVARNRKMASASHAPQAEEAGAPEGPGLAPSPLSPPSFPPLVPVRQDLLVDGQVVKASYNTGGQERVVHVTVVRSTGEGERQRFILGARPTGLDRHGEWGAALSLLEALPPRPPHVRVLVSGDAGFCVEEFAAWLALRSLGDRFRIKKNAGGLYTRGAEWAEWTQKRRPEGDFYEACRISGAALDSRRLWRLPGLRFARFPGITEGFVIEKRVLLNEPLPNSNMTSRASRASPGPAQRSWSGSYGIGIPRPGSSG
jgi:hypothetical protein